MANEDHFYNDNLIIILVVLLIIAFVLLLMQILSAGMGSAAAEGGLLLEGGMAAADGMIAEDLLAAGRVRGISTAADAEMIGGEVGSVIGESTLVSLAEATEAITILDDALIAFHTQAAAGADLMESIGGILNVAGAYQNLDEALNGANADAKSTASDIIQALVGGE